MIFRNLDEAMASSASIVATAMVTTNKVHHLWEL